MMLKKLGLVVVCFVVIILSLFAIGNFKSIFESGVSAQQPEMPIAGPHLAQAVVIPQHVIYGQLFRHIEALKEKATESQQQGQNVAWLNSFYQKEANLNAVQSSELDRIATECNQRTKTLDLQAKQIIDGIRSRYVNGKLQEGEKPPLPPAELYELQRQRNEAVLNAKNDLKQSFGESQFNSFDSFVQTEIKQMVRPIKLNQHTVAEIPPAFQ